MVFSLQYIHYIVIRCHNTGCFWCIYYNSFARLRMDPYWVSSFFIHPHFVNNIFVVPSLLGSCLQYIYYYTYTCCESKRFYSRYFFFVLNSNGSSIIFNVFKALSIKIYFSIRIEHFNHIFFSFLENQTVCMSWCLTFVLKFISTLYFYCWSLISDGNGATNYTAFINR